MQRFEPTNLKFRACVRRYAFVHDSRLTVLKRVELFLAQMFLDRYGGVYRCDLFTVVYDFIHIILPLPGETIIVVVCVRICIIYH